VAISRDHAAAARAGGDAVELVVPESTGHAELIDPGSTAWPAAGSWLEPRNRGARGANATGLGGTRRLRPATGGALPCPPTSH
jgi:hypothetical protein